MEILQFLSDIILHFSYFTIKHHIYLLSNLYRNFIVVNLIRRYRPRCNLVDFHGLRIIVLSDFWRRYLGSIFLNHLICLFLQFTQLLLKVFLNIDLRRRWLVHLLLSHLRLLWRLHLSNGRFRCPHVSSPSFNFTVPHTLILTDTHRALTFSIRCMRWSYWLRRLHRPLKLQTRYLFTWRELNLVFAFFYVF